MYGKAFFAILPARGSKSGYVAGQFPVILLFDLDDGAYRGISRDPVMRRARDSSGHFIRKVYNKDGLGRLHNPGCSFV